MRLIDADEFKKQIAGMAIVNNYSADKANKLCELIDNQPIAYDVDKVVERLEELIKTEYEKSKNSDKNRFVDGEGIYEDGRTQGKYEAYKESLEIVKSGGIQHPDSTHTDTENVAANWKEHLAGRFNRFE